SSRKSLHCLALLFFFSSRRRHTRSKRDWSSDVCSSDLIALFHFTQIKRFRFIKVSANINADIVETGFIRAAAKVTHHGCLSVKYHANRKIHRANGAGSGIEFFLNLFIGGKGERYLEKT